LSTVVRWLLAHGVIDDENLLETAVIIRDFNDALEMRRDPAARARRLKYLQELKAIDAGSGTLRQSG
jgi:hypothetical protein